jgi:hypothetical protein
MSGYLDDIEKHLEAVRLRRAQRKLDEQNEKSKSEAKADTPHKDNSSSLY